MEEKLKNFKKHQLIKEKKVFSLLSYAASTTQLAVTRPCYHFIIIIFNFDK